MKVWVLTSEYNDYDQYGEYFLAVFKEKPTVEQLAPYIDEYYCTAEWVLKRGGRVDYENCWYWLREVEAL